MLYMGNTSRKLDPTLKRKAWILSILPGQVENIMLY